MRHKLLNLLVDMLISRYGLYPKTVEKTMVAKAAVVLFPHFKVDDTEHGIVSHFATMFSELIFMFIFSLMFQQFLSHLKELFYDKAKNLGWLVSVFKVRRKLQSRNKNPVQEVNENNNDQSTLYTEENEKEDTEFLRTVVVNKTNMQLIEQKLKMTIDYRKQLCKDPNTNVLVHFPYFFTHSELVIYLFNNNFIILVNTISILMQILLDFDIRFGIERNIFFNEWNNCKVNVKTALQLHLSNDNLDYDYEEDVEHILLLLKLLPERQKGRKTAAMRLHFTDAIEKLVVFSKVVYGILFCAQTN